MNSSTAVNNFATHRLQTLPENYLIFHLGDHSYGIPAIKVCEFTRLKPVTPPPRLAGHIRGMIHLHDKVISVMDLRSKFGLEEIAPTETTRIVVVKVALASGVEVHLGLIVDAVEELALINGRDLEETPEFGLVPDPEYVLGVAKLKGVARILLDLEKLVSGDIRELFPVHPSPCSR